ncbi:hypothetical protein HK102_008795, partial [Quaeritorhiza haematococci]
VKLSIELEEGEEVSEEVVSSFVVDKDGDENELDNEGEDGEETFKEVASVFEFIVVDEVGDEAKLVGESDFVAVDEDSDDDNFNGPGGVEATEEESEEVVFIF